MLRKVTFFCLSAILIQTVTCQCVKNCLNNGLAEEIVAGASNGGRFTITCSSKIPSTGLMVQSDNLAVDGPLTVCGQVPFLGVVALNGVLPADGIGAVQYECGNGRVGITEEVEENALQRVTNVVGKNPGVGNCNCLGVGKPASGYRLL